MKKLLLPILIIIISCNNLISELNWEQFKTPIPKPHNSILLEGDSTIYISTNKIFKSTNLGNSWTELYNFGETEILKICSSGNGVYYAVAGYRIYKSDKNMTTWEEISGNTNFEYAKNLFYCKDSIISFYSENIYDYPDKYFYKSTDCGINWEKYIYENEFKPAFCQSSSNLYCIKEVAPENYKGRKYTYHLLRSMDFGKSWKVFSVINTDMIMQFVKALDSNSFIIFNDIESMSYYKKNENGKFTNTVISNNLYLHSIEQIDNGYLIACSKTVYDEYSEMSYKGIILNLKDGNLLETKLELPIEHYFYSIRKHKSGIVFALSDIGIFKSSDNGNNWKLFSPPDPENMSYPQFKFKNNNTYIAEDNILYISKDNCQTWDYISLDFTYSIHSYDITANGDIYIGSGGNGLWRSTDEGITWEQILYNIFNDCVQSVFVSDSGYILVYGWSYFAISKDNGSNWSYTQVIGRVSQERWNTIKVLSNNTILLQSNIESLMKSTDWGETWEEIDLVINDEKLVFDEVRVDIHDNIYSLLSNSVFKSSDYGLTWSELKIPIEEYKINDVYPISEDLLLISASRQLWDNSNVFVESYLFLFKDDSCLVNVSGNLPNDKIFYDIFLDDKSKIIVSQKNGNTFRLNENLMVDSKYLKAVIQKISEFDRKDPHYFDHIDYKIKVLDTDNKPIENVRIKVNQNERSFESSYFHTDNFGTSYLSIDNDSIVIGDEIILNFKISHNDFKNSFYMPIALLEGTSIVKNNNYKIGDYEPEDTISFLFYSIVHLEQLRSLDEVEYLLYNPFTDSYEYFECSKDDYQEYEYMIPHRTSYGDYSFILYARSEGFIFEENVYKVSVKTETNIQEQITKEEIQIIPNPSSDYIIIRNSPPDVEYLEIFDINGRVVKSISVLEYKNGDILIDLKDLVSSQYILKIYSNDQVVSKLLIKD